VKEEFTKPKILSWFEKMINHNENDKGSNGFKSAAVGNTVQCAQA